jgi:hypothetical protein
MDEEMITRSMTTDQDDATGSEGELLNNSGQRSSPQKLCLVRADYDDLKGVEDLHGRRTEHVITGDEATGSQNEDGDGLDMAVTEIIDSPEAKDTWITKLDLRGLQWTACVIYLDGVIISGLSFEQHLGK